MSGTNARTPSAVAPDAVDRVARADALQEIDALLSDRPAADVLEALDDVGVPAGRIRTVPEVYDWRQVRESMVLTLPRPTLGDLDVHAPALGGR